MQSNGSRLTAIMGNRTTIDYMFQNQKVKNYTPFSVITSGTYILGQTDVERIIESRLGHSVRIIVNEEMYRGWDGNLHNYMQPNRVILIGGDSLGTTWNGRTYEEDSNLVNGGNGYTTQTRLANGIVISDYFKKDPDEKVFRVSRAVIPSFEGMNKVYNLIWIDDQTQYTITYNENGGAGITPHPQGVNKTEAMGYVMPGQALNKNGKKFIKWNTNAGGTGTDITPSYVPTGNTTVYAIYEA